ncbi:hypothetical protein ACFQU7_06010 [Pseudoroseomonas wenyumeiae]
MTARLALYWAPEVADPLHAAASRWLGRDAETGATFLQEPCPAWISVRSQPIRATMASTPP